jgi:hypothetical protein
MNGWAVNNEHGSCCDSYSVRANIEYYKSCSSHYIRPLFVPHITSKSAHSIGIRRFCFYPAFDAFRAKYPEVCDEFTWNRKSDETHSKLFNRSVMLYTDSYMAGQTAIVYECFAWDLYSSSD